jgi:hypothetical protein
MEVLVSMLSLVFSANANQDGRDYDVRKVSIPLILS